MYYWNNDDYSYLKTTNLSMKITPTSQAARPNGPQYSNDFFATGAALDDRGLQLVKIRQILRNRKSKKEISSTETT